MTDKNKNQPASKEEEWFPIRPPFEGETVIEKIIASYPSSHIRDAFEELELHCYSCPVSPRDDLEDVARLHEKQADLLIERLGDLLSETDPLDEPDYWT